MPHLDGFAAGAREDVARPQSMAGNHVLAAGCDDVDLQVVVHTASALLKADPQTRPLGFGGL